MYIFFLNLANAEDINLANAEEQSFATSLTINPRQIVNTVVEGHVEHSISPQVGLGAVLGFGRSQSEFTSEIGLNGRYYPIGDFNGGLAVSGQFMYVNILYQQEENRVNGHLFIPGAFISGKYIFDIGFTIDTQLGINHIVAVVKDKSIDKSLQSSDWKLLFNCNLGWSF